MIIKHTYTIGKGFKIDLKCGGGAQKTKCEI